MKTKNMKKQDACGGALAGTDRPNGRQMKTKSISMPDHLWLRLDEVRGKLSRSAAIRRFITDYGDGLMRKLQAERERRFAAWLP
jgi:hypothetical protein